jgi:hypothetical protein
LNCITNLILKFQDPPFELRLDLHQGVVADITNLQVLLLLLLEKLDFDIFNAEFTTKNIWNHIQITSFSP